MDGFLSKCISIIIIFVMLIVAPLINIYGTHEMQGRMMVLNDTSNFLDKVCDKGEITQEDIDEFYSTIASRGMILDASIDRLIKTVTKMDNGELSTAYIAADDISKLSQGNLVLVRIEEVSTTPYKKLLRTFLRINEPKYSLTLSKMVR